MITETLPQATVSTVIPSTIPAPRSATSTGPETGSPGQPSDRSGLPGGPAWWPGGPSGSPRLREGPPLTHGQLARPTAATATEIPTMKTETFPKAIGSTAIPISRHTPTSAVSTRPEAGSPGQPSGPPGEPRGPTWWRGGPSVTQRRPEGPTSITRVTRAVPTMITETLPQATVSTVIPSTIPAPRSAGATGPETGSPGEPSGPPGEPRGPTWWRGEPPVTQGRPEGPTTTTRVTTAEVPTMITETLPQATVSTVIPSTSPSPRSAASAGPETGSPGQPSDRSGLPGGPAWWPGGPSGSPRLPEVPPVTQGQLARPTAATATGIPTMITGTFPKTIGSTAIPISRHTPTSAASTKPEAGSPGQPSGPPGEPRGPTWWRGGPPVTQGRPEGPATATRVTTIEVNTMRTEKLPEPTVSTVIPSTSPSPRSAASTGPETGSPGQQSGRSGLPGGPAWWPGGPSGSSGQPSGSPRQPVGPPGLPGGTPGSPVLLEEPPGK